SSTFGKNILPKVGAKLDCQPLSDVSSIISEDTFVRPIYAGNAFVTVKSLDKIKLLTIRTTSFDAVETHSGTGTIEKLDLVFDNPKIKFISKEAPVSDRPELTSAKVVISGGRGLQSAENFKMLASLADKLNAAIGASR